MNRREWLAAAAVVAMLVAVGLTQVDWAGHLITGIMFLTNGVWVGMVLSERFIDAARSHAESAFGAANRAQDGWKAANETSGQAFALYRSAVYVSRNYLLGHLSYDELKAFVESHIGDIHRDPELPN